MLAKLKPSPLGWTVITAAGGWLAIVVLGSALLETAPGPPTGSHVSVIRVIDDDTVVLAGGDRVRLWGIDAPEGANPTGTLYQALRAPSPADPTRVEILADHGMDRYGRRVLQLGYGGGDIACHLVNLGVARDWPRYSGGAYRECVSRPKTQ